MGDAEDCEEKQHRWGWENAIVGGGVCVCVLHTALYRVMVG